MSTRVMSLKVILTTSEMFGDKCVNGREWQEKIRRAFWATVAPAPPAGCALINRTPRSKSVQFRHPRTELSQGHCGLDNFAHHILIVDNHILCPSDRSQSSTRSLCHNPRDDPPHQLLVWNSAAALYLVPSSPHPRPRSRTYTLAALVYETTLLYTSIDK